MLNGLFITKYKRVNVHWLFTTITSTGMLTTRRWRTLPGLCAEHTPSRGRRFQQLCTPGSGHYRRGARSTVIRNLSIRFSFWLLWDYHFRVIESKTLSLSLSLNWVLTKLRCVRLECGRWRWCLCVWVGVGEELKKAFVRLWPSEVL